jgi:hypothetical protein
LRVEQEKGFLRHGGGGGGGGGGQVRPSFLLFSALSNKFYEGSFTKSFPSSYPFEKSPRRVKRAGEGRRKEGSKPRKEAPFSSPPSQRPSFRYPARFKDSFLVLLLLLAEVGLRPTTTLQGGRKKLDIVGDTVDRHCR